MRIKNWAPNPESIRLGVRVAAALSKIRTVVNAMAIGCKKADRNSIQCNVIGGFDLLFTVYLTRICHGIYIAVILKSANFAVCA